MNPVWIITGKEVRDSLRNRWVLAASVLLAALALSLGFLGSSPTGSVKVDPLTVTVVSLSSLSIFLIPLNRHAPLLRFPYRRKSNAAPWRCC